MSSGSSSLPSAVRLREVGPRDGFQNEPELIATPDKVRLIELLARTGFKRLEVTSFVRADVIPQLADGVEVLQTIDVPDDVERNVIVPTPKGLDRALAVAEHLEQITVFLSASDGHNKHNVNRTVDESLEGLVTMLPRIREAGLRAGAAISTSFGCPYDGHVPPERVAEICARLTEAGAEELGLADTTGMANPLSVAEVFGRVGDAVGGEVELTAHFHNTRGSGLANVLAALQAGCDSFESSFGELGGCPVPAGATGNIASEDLISLLHEMGIETGVDLGKVLEATREVQRVLGRPLASRTLVAGPVDWEPQA
jgi:hydroxymethylglutaryl-CoA lyase